MARSWTKRQTDAMNTRDRTLLVSAAAGSGKTATLTERIIRSILDEHDPININEMLIVTFTKAATGELRERISAALKGAISASGGDERLERQLHLLPSAAISTIDSFCSSILKNNCERVGIDPGYRIIDPAEAELLSESILDGMLGAIYEGELASVATPDELERLADCLTDTKTQGDLSAVIRMFYDSTKDLIAGVGTLGDLVEEYNPGEFKSVEKTRLGEYAMLSVRQFAEHYLRVMSACLNEHMDFGPTVAKKIEVLTGDVEFLTAVLKADTYDAVRDVFMNRNHPNTPSVGKAAPTLSYATALRKELKSETERIRATFLDFSTDEWRECYGGLYELLSVLVRLLEHFHEAFKAEKMRISALEYSDVTRFTYECLWHNGERTDVAVSESMRYRAIYIDEYQDVNALQHKIFEAISTDTNRFMVGDIKQSIYGFRGADPSIFADMKTSFVPLGKSGDSPSASIFMSENFRCDKGVIDFVNLIFDKLFSVLRESIGFVPDDALVFSKVYDGDMPEYRKPEVCLLPYKLDKSGAEDDDDDDIGLAPMVVAAKIRELLSSGTLNNGKPVTPGDIAIIMRNTSGKDVKYAAALAREGIPSAITESESIFLNPDILLLMSILHSIDNPRRDIYLAGAMCSPVFGFSADELVRISALGEPTLYDGLVRYVAENPEYERGAGMLRWLSRYRTAAEGCSVDSLINRLYRDTGLLALAAKRGGKDDLIRFYEHARQFENSSFRGLYNFINYVNGIIGRQNAFDKKEASLGGDEVKIITAHSSKGLEFPIVFFVGSDQAMKRRKDAEARLVYNNRFGISLRLRTPSGLALVSNPTRPILLDYALRRKIEEEARVLYVILTRARERLFVVGKCRSGIEKYREEIEKSHEYLSTHTVYSMSDYTDMITYSSGRSFLEVSEFLENVPEHIASRLYPAAADEDESGESFELPEALPEEILFAEDRPVAVPDVEENTKLCLDDFTETLLQRFEFKYPHAAMSEIPRKLSVSRLYPDILDPSDDEAASLEDDERITKMGRLPVFATGSDETESARRGIATHLLFQFCDFSALRDTGAAAELDRLKRESYLSAEDAARVRLPEVEAFRRSALFSDMLAATRIWRELRFNTRLPASYFTTDDERREQLRSESILVQGVIDCLYEDSDGNLHLVDYKTDRLTREERENPELAEERLRSSHSLQLSYYAMAVEKMFGKRPVSVEVYSLHLGRAVSVM